VIGYQDVYERLVMHYEALIAASDWRQYRNTSEESLYPGRDSNPKLA
jgi:hypothetical protein